MKKQIKVILLLLCVSAIQPVFAQSKILTTLSDIFFLFQKDLASYSNQGRMIIESFKDWENLSNTLDALKGQETARKEFQAIMDYILNGEQKDTLTPPQFLVLTGEPRSGKTFSVNCLGGSLKHELEKNGSRDVRYFRITPAKIAKCGGIEKIFSILNNYLPAVVFIDGLEVDNKNKILGEYLRVLTDFNQKYPKKLFLIVAANNTNIDVKLGTIGKHISFN